ncbi:protein GLUTAMINE DUMPER 2-like [Papaver somniferum]|uniref:protein GLUTAMINE DUMPER 2-like n=1 Tax=Papaver somniferum TaxID=3469 RepID=UPI000E6FEC99|nr:protein GLUTAMINE DUMPER 2-like [Papaver somniferum]
MRNGGTISFLSTATLATSPIQSPRLHSSPIPFLFGGLAAMFCLIAIALLILASSTWKLSMFLCNDNNCEGSTHRGGGGGGDKSAEEESVKVVYEGQIGLIMAGDVKPTYLAVPRSLGEKPKENEDQSDVIRRALENPHHQTQ